MTLANTIAALFTLCIFSLIWRENPVFRFAEHLLLGLAAAHTMIVTLDNFIKPTVKNEIVGEGRWYYIIPILFGALIYLRYIPKVSWAARYPVSWFVGYGAGYALALTPKPLLTQITDTFIPFHSIDAVIYFFVTTITISYFFLTAKWKESTNFGRALDVWARRVIMVGLGASFGNVVQGYISRMLDRLSFLFIDWLGFGI